MVLRMEETLVPALFVEGETGPPGVHVVRVCIYIFRLMQVELVNFFKPVASPDSVLLSWCVNIFLDTPLTLLVI